MIDIDHFKDFNDDFGHDAGDAVLAAIGRHLREFVRGEDIACRYGGEELILVWPGADLAAGRKRAEQLREQLRALSVHLPGQALRPVTVSIGVSQLGVNGDTPETTIAAADLALYRAKGEGRDRVVVATGIGESVGASVEQHPATRESSAA
jgi:diguanylate cyclase (GGDEF)-like protein